MAAPDMNRPRAFRAMIRRERRDVLAFGERMDNAFGLVLVLVFATVVLGELRPFQGWWGVAITALGAFSSMFALRTAKAGSRAVRWGGRLAALAIIVAAIGAASDSRQVFAVSALLTTLLLLAGALAVLRAVVLEEKVGFRTILGAVSVYLILGLLFTFVFVAVARIQGGEFFGQPTQQGDFLFFSLTTLTTTGYGDLVPAAQPGRMLSNLEMLVGQVFLVTLIARLVSMWTPGQRLRDEFFPGADDDRSDPQ